MQGIGEGFYADPNYLADSSCLDDDSLDALFNLIEGFSHGGGVLQTSLKIVTAAQTFVTSVLQNCNTHKFVYDTITFCFKGHCGGFYMVTNFALYIGTVSLSFGGIF